EEARRIEDDARIEEAETLEKEGDDEAAAAVLSAPRIAPPVALPKAKADGLAMVETWNFEIERAEIIPREYLKPDEKAIGAVVRGLKAGARIPGIRIWRELRPRAAGQRQ